MLTVRTDSLPGSGFPGRGSSAEVSCLECILGRSPEVLAVVWRAGVDRCLRRILMKKRKSLSRKKSKKMFRKGASKVHPKNYAPMPMRGGIRA